MTSDSPIINETSFLKQAIIQKDLNFIKEYLAVSEEINRDAQIEKDIDELDLEERKRLLRILKGNFIVSGLSVEILELAKKVIIKSEKYVTDSSFCESVDHFCTMLGRSTNEYGKMHYLKGKIEYLKYKKEAFKDEEDKKPLEVIEDEDL